jgi:hypothetical protein
LIQTHILRGRLPLLPHQSLTLTHTYAQRQAVFQAVAGVLIKYLATVAPCLLRPKLPRKGTAGRYPRR